MLWSEIELVCRFENKSSANRFSYQIKPGWVDFETYKERDRNSEEIESSQHYKGSGSSWDIA